MIVRQFLHWVRQASAGERAEATSALARAYLYSDLSSDDRAAAEGAMIMLLDDRASVRNAALKSLPKVVGRDVTAEADPPLATAAHKAEYWKRWHQQHGT